MAEKTIPWWRRALGFALNGIRSGFGLFSRPATLEPLTEPDLSARSEENLEEEEALTIHSPNPEPDASEPVNEVEAVPSLAPEALGVPAIEAAPDPQPAPEPVTEAASESQAEPTPEPEAVSAPDAVSAPIPEPASQAEPEPESEPEILIETATEPQQDLEVIAESAPEPEPVSAALAEPVEEEEPESTTVPEPEPEAVVETESPQLQEFETAAEIAPEPEPVSAATPEPVDEEQPEPAVIPAPEPEPEPAIQAVPDLQPAPEPSAEAAEPVQQTEPEPIAAAPEALPEPASAPAPPPAAIAQQSAEFSPAPATQPAADEKAAKPPIKIETRDNEADLSPFSVIVSQVYDGPLDLLLDLIRKQDIDIYDIPIARITAQFLAYVNQLKASDVDVAGEFIYTASLLIHIKSRMLLPRTPSGPDEAAEDPRRELVERLLEHERFKNAAQMLQQKQMLEAATWTNPGVREFREDTGAEPEIAADTTDLVRIFRDILDRARRRPVIDVEEDTVTVGQMIQFLARRLTLEDKPIALRRLLSHTRSERALIAMFLALLELVRLQAILLRQDRAFSEIFIKKNTGFDAAMNEGLANARDDWR